MGEPEPQEGEAIAPVQRLTPAQRRLLLTWARTGSHAAAAAELGIAASTVKNHLSNVYHRLGVTNGIQALYLVMGGDDVARALPPPRSRLAAKEHKRGPYAGSTSSYVAMPVMIDGQIELEDLRTAARIGDAEADGSPRASLSECVEFISYYVRPKTYRGRRSTEAVAGG